MLDFGVAAMAMGGLVWTVLLHPAMEAVRAETGPRMTILLGILALSGVLGALLRLWFAGGRLPTLPLLLIGSLLATTLVLIRVGRLARQRERAELRLRHQATHDPLTGLPNRAELLTRLSAALDRERAGGHPSVILLFCDLNGFKQVNDRLGHEAGDQLLAAVAERIRTGLRAGDTLARYGGDEFLLLCEDDAPESAALRLTGHVEKALAEPFVLAGELVTVGSSVGAVISAGDRGADELISRADQAMYRAKEQHRATLGTQLD
jgi:diguanylate cyclase (GGDEF)-like protein